MDYTVRVNRAQQMMREQRIDLLAIPPGDDLAYLVGFSTLADERPCYLFLTPETGVFLVPELNAVQAERHIHYPFLTYSDVQGPSKALAAARSQFKGIRRIGIGDTMRADALLLLQRTWKEAEYTEGSDILAPMRMFKSPDEIAALKRAAATADQAIEAAYAAVQSGRTEAEIARVATDAFYAAGADSVLNTIVASGPNSAYPHHHTSSRRIQTQEPVMFDFGSRLDGYSSDITRMSYVGTPSARYLEIHRIVEEAVVAALAAITPGAPLRVVDMAARGVIDRAGHGKHFVHRTGHGLGRTGHEPPSVTGTNDLQMAAGMVFSVEPGIYLDGQFGARLEEIVVVTERGAQRLSQLSRDVHVIAT
ncbi:MAG TPA: Xaa-Pro peptidase family protein [bacterium]|nr:Xaa-Pro peptidase family protein [bacterium]